jgi:CzcA family heavy metal efflux pump
MSFVAWIEHHRRSIILVVLALAFAGAVSALSLPVGLFPQTAFPRAVVTLDAGDRPADQMTLLVTVPIEQAVRLVPGVRHIRSRSSRGAAQVSLDFDWGVDMVATTLQIDAAIASVLPSLPPGTAYTVRRMDPTTFPIIAYGLTPDSESAASGGGSPIALRDLAQYRIVPLLSTIRGVARIDVLGGGQQEIEVSIDPHRLTMEGLAMTDVTGALAAANVLTAVGRIEDHHKLYLVVADETLNKLEQIRAVVVKSGPNGVVRVGDIAEVTDGTVPAWIKVVEDGKSAVLFQVYQQPDGNSVQIAQDVRQKLAAFGPQLPVGVKLAKWYDQSELVTQSAASVRDAIFIGLGLAAIVLLVFLRNWRTTLVAMLVVPATLASTVLVLSMIGASFNIMTLGGIAAAVGLVIDDVIVMIEHIARRAGRSAEAGGGVAAVLPAGREFLRPLSGSSLATLIVFFPLGFLTGVTGAFFKALSVTMGSALVISFLLTAFAVPVLAKQVIDFRTWHDPAQAREPWLERQHRRLLDTIFTAPWLIAAGILPLLVLGWVAYSHVGTGFMPAMDEGGFVLDYRTSPGTSLTETDRELRQVEAILKATPEVATFSRRTGLGLGGDLNEANQGDFFVRLTPQPRRDSDEIMADIRRAIEQQVPGVDVELAQLMEDLIGDLTAVPQPIEVKLYAADPAALIPAAQKIAGAVSKVEGVVDVRNGVTLAGDAINVRIDPVAAGLEGMDPAQISNQLDTYLTGTVATNLPSTVKQIGVRVRLAAALREHEDDLTALPIRAPDGHVFALGRVARFATDPGQPEITRDDLQRMVAVTARIEGRDLGSTVQDVRQLLDRPGTLPAGVTYALGGLYEQQQIAFGGLLKVFAAALVAELVLLLFLYERLLLPLIIIATALLSTSAVFTALWLTGIELNITAMMGMTMIVGIATEMAIFYVSEFAELAHTMPARQALLEASRNRLRPIAMTTLAAILTLMPLALGLGEGSAMQQPLAVAIIAGLTLQFPLVLLAMPVLIGLAGRANARTWEAV